MYVVLSPFCNHGNCAQWSILLSRLLLQVKVVARIRAQDHLAGTVFTSPCLGGGGGGGVLLQCSVETGEGLTPGGQKGSYQTCPFLATASAFSNCSLQFWMHLAGTAVYLISCFLFGVILQRKAPEISLGKQCVSTAVMNLIPTCLLYSL